MWFSTLVGDLTTGPGQDKMAEATIAYCGSPEADWTSKGKAWGWDGIAESPMYISSQVANQVSWKSAPATDELALLNSRINF